VLLVLALLELSSVPSNLGWLCLVPNCDHYCQHNMQGCEAARACLRYSPGSEESRDCHDEGVHTKQYLLTSSSYEDDEILAPGEPDPGMVLDEMGAET
jgi:hypothetical protein